MFGSEDFLMCVRGLHWCFASIGSICVAAWFGFSLPALGQQMPVYSAPPRQMPASVAPETYPSTDAAAYPATNAGNYPATNAGAYPPANDRGYQSTSTPAQTAAGGLSPYDEVMPGISTGAVRASYDEAGPLYEPYGSPAAMNAAANSMASGAYVDRALIFAEPWTWQLLPSGLMYKSYLAGGREPRFGSQWVRMRDEGWLWDATLGGRAGLLRYGTDNAIRPEGWQLDVEGAAFPRLDLENERDLVSADFRIGGLLTTRRGCWEAKFGYYHLSSHLGDEYILRHPDVDRINYVRDSLVLGMAVYFGPNLRVYSEAGCAFNTDGGAEPWEFQCGADLSPAEPTGRWGAPFLAVNGHLREENDFGGNMTVQTGWQWRGQTGHLLRVGMQYFNGFSDQYQFYNIFEEQIGVGLWYDF